ncbi:uncharacterized protein LOC111328760 [Stylophora pistillata]|uniref:uncharacterized protein LOC111328760 n=1 Tax=Stylophora pistillata TaxID=50429 RepID=UPI000C03E2B7|nr:uncharacterized protein LOC111328760 [Stylophora pistillata]
MANFSVGCSSRLDSGTLFQDYDLLKVAQLSISIEEMDAVTMNYWLSKFVMKVAKNLGEIYPPKTAYEIIFRIHKVESFHYLVSNLYLDKRLQGKHECRSDYGHDECCICQEQSDKLGR